MTTLADEVDELARTNDFAGVVSVSRGETVEFERAYGLAVRAHGVPVELDTRFGVASVTKGFTALTIASLIDDGLLTFDTTARSVLGPALPLIRTDVTVYHLLSHTSGLGDYVDEEAGGGMDDYVLKVPVHTLATTEGYLPALDGFATKFSAGERFSYSNIGFVVLALIAERVTGRPFHDLVAERVFGPAGMTSSAFLRSDDLPGSAAIGYLSDGRTNVMHLPVRGSGDGGAFTTVADLRAFWSALFAGWILASGQVAYLTRPRNYVPAEELHYGLGFWRHGTSGAVILTGGDVGVAAWTIHSPHTAVTGIVLGNTATGAGPIKRHLNKRLG